MFVVNDDFSIFLTRGDIAVLQISADKSEEEQYIFTRGDVLRLRVFEKKKPDVVVLQKDVVVDGEVSLVDIFLSKEDTKIGELISKPTDYWYEVELNPDTMPQTIIGYDEDGPKIFRLFPEGADQ